MIQAMRSSWVVFVSVVGGLALIGSAVACSNDTGNASSSSSGGGTSSSGTTSGASGGTSGEQSSGTSGATSGGTSGQQPPPSKVNQTNETVDVDGTPRRYVLQVPKTYDAAKSYPLILALHGDGDSAAGFPSSFNIAAFSGDDAIVAFSDQSVDLFTEYANNKDQRLIEVMIETLKGKYTIDANKVWGAGYSKGAYQLNELACRKPGLLKAMAIHAGGAPQERNGDGSVNCPAAIALPTFVTHGGNDDPGGGRFGADYWAGLAGCQDNLSASTPSICEKFNGCPADKQVFFCLVPNQPHSPLYKDAAEHTWNWFKTL